MNDIDVKEIIVHAKAGSAIWDCKYEAAVLTLSERRKVVLVHNERRYAIDPSDMVSVFKEN